VVCVIVTTFSLVLTDPERLLPDELGSDSAELDDETETSLPPDVAIVGAADSPELTDDS
jgi:hypothetical protein